VVLIIYYLLRYYPFFFELENKKTLNIIGKVTTTMAIAVLITNIPIVIIYFSKTLMNVLNRILNIIAGILTLFILYM